MNANQYIVIIDSQFRYAVSSAVLADSTEDQVRAMDGEQYGAWCDAHPMDRTRGDVGSQGCIDFCNELIEAGAEVWHLS